MKRLLLLALLLVVGCDATQDGPNITQLFYYQDPRSGMCFAVPFYAGARDLRGLTYVPCTPEVLRLIPRVLAAPTQCVQEPAQ